MDGSEDARQDVIGAGDADDMDVLCEVQNYVKLVRPPPLISPPFKTFFSTFFDITTHNSVR